MNKPKCFMCGHDLIEKKTSIKAGWNEYKVEITGITGLVCEGCKESIFSETCVSMIQRLAKVFASFSEEKRPNIIDISNIEELLMENNILNQIESGQVKIVKEGKKHKVNI